MYRYKEFQFATIIFVIAIPAQIFLNIAFATSTESRMSITSFAIANAVFLLIYLLFYGMTTTIDHDKIRVHFGVGLIWKTVRLADIQSVTIVSNPWYYGWGIRLIPNGWLYNISGFASVELTFTHTSRVVRIGSANAASLKEAICDRQPRP